MLLNNVMTNHQIKKEKKLQAFQQKLNLEIKINKLKFYEQIYAH